MSAEPPNWTRRLARRSTDLLAIAILAAGVLAVSGRLTEWWSTDSSQVLDPSLSVSQISGSQTTWGAGETPVAMRLGQLPVTMHRQLVLGDENRAVEHARKTCRDILQRAHSTQRPIQPINDSERQLLDQLKSAKPIDQEPHQWEIFRIDEPGAIVIGAMFLGVRWHESKDGEPRRELLCWSMATPSQQTQWTLFTFEKTGIPQETLPRIPLPPGSQLVLSLSDPTGGQLTSFEATVSDGEPALELARWRDFFDARFQQESWQSTRAWTQTSNGWSARYESSAQACELLLNTRANSVSGLANVISR